MTLKLMSARSPGKTILSKELTELMFEAWSDNKQLVVQMPRRVGSAMVRKVLDKLNQDIASRCRKL